VNTAPLRQYRAPQVAPGDHLVCAVAGEVEVETFTHGAIRWPISTALKIIFCGDLLDALENDSVDVIVRVWEVSPTKVYEWRKLLGIRGHSPGRPRTAAPRKPGAPRLPAGGQRAAHAGADSPPVPMPRYTAPDVRVGDTLHCALAGDVIVAGFWKASELRWPMHRRAAHGSMSLIYCGDLLRALNELHVESLSALWGVLAVTVRAWRRALGIPASDATRLRPSVPAPFCVPQRCEAAIGDTLTCAIAGPSRVVAIGPAPLAWPLRAGTDQHEPIFCGELPAYVLTAPLHEVARVLDVTAATVRDWRAALNPAVKPPAGRAQDPAWQAAIADPAQSIQSIAAQFGVRPAEVGRARAALARRARVPNRGAYPGHTTIDTLLACWPMSPRWISHRCDLLVRELAGYRERKTSLAPAAYRALCALLALSEADGANDADGPLPLPAGRYVLLASDTAEEVVEAYNLLSWDGNVGFCAELVTEAPAHADNEFRYLVFSAPGRFAPHLIVFPREGPSVDLLDEPEGDRSLTGYRGTFPVDADTFALVAGEWERVMTDASLASRAFAHGRDVALLAKLQEVARYFLAHLPATYSSDIISDLM